MGLLQMSVSGALMVAAILLVRAAALNRLPKQVFVVLWALVAARLLVPVDVPLPFSAFNLVDRVVGAAQTIAGTGDAASQTSGADAVPGADPTDAAGTAASDGALPSPAAAPAATPSYGAGSGSPSPSEQASASPSDAAPAQTPGGLPALRAVALVVWLVGAAGCGAFFAASYLRCRRDFRMSLPVRDPRVEAWLDRNGAGPLSRRPVEVRQTDLVASPLSYGVAHPVILMPKALGWDDGRVPFVLAHELAHIRRGDQLLKLAFAATVCIHWFNPFAWAMFVLANRDIELACDERAVRTLGTELRADYARTLLSMAQRRDLPSLLYTAFGKNAVEERIGAVMKLRTQRVTAVSLIASIALVVGIPAALATSAVEPVPAGQTPAAGADAADGTEAAEADAGDNDPAGSMPDGWPSGSKAPAGYTDEEWSSVLDFLDSQFELVGGVSNEVSVADFRTAALETFGDAAGQDLLARLAADDTLYRRALDESFAVENGIDTYIVDRLAEVCFALVPLATGDGRTVVFSGSTSADDGSGDAFSYELTFALEDPAAVNIYVYLTAALYSTVDLDRMFDLADTALRAPGLDAADRTEQLDGFLTDMLERGPTGLPLYGLPATLAYTYTPGDGSGAATGTVELSTTEEEADAAVYRVQQSLGQAVMREYRAYGLTQIDVPAESAGATAGYVFAFDGQSVRRIYDASLGEVVTDWLDAPVISDDSSVDLVADYDIDGLAGLHVAAEGEIEAYQDAYPLMPGNPDLLANGMPIGGAADAAETPATIEDVLAGYTDAEWGMVTRFISEQFDVSSTGYRASSVADFRAAANEAFGTPEGQDLLARLAADENLADWAQGHVHEHAHAEYERPVRLLRVAAAFGR